MCEFVVSTTARAFRPDIHGGERRVLMLGREYMGTFMRDGLLDDVMPATAGVEPEWLEADGMAESWSDGGYAKLALAGDDWDEDDDDSFEDDDEEEFFDDDDEDEFEDDDEEEDEEEFDDMDD
jgi:hypothetical protein